MSEIIIMILLNIIVQKLAYKAGYIFHWYIRSQNCLELTNIKINVCNSPCELLFLKRVVDIVEILYWMVAIFSRLLCSLDRLY